MRQSPKSPETKERGVIKSDLYDVVEDLRMEAFEKGISSVAHSPRMYILERNITPRSLENLGSLNFENMLYDFEGNLHFQTGQKGRAMPKYPRSMSGARAARKDDTQARLARFTLHNHPIGRPGTLAVTSGDYAFSQGNSAEIDFIATKDGIIGYKGDHEKNYFDVRILVKLARALQNPNRTIREQQITGVARFFIPWRGDENSNKQLETICQYINDPAMQWGAIQNTVET